MSIALKARLQAQTSPLLCPLADVVVLGACVAVGAVACAAGGGLALAGVSLALAEAAWYVIGKFRCDGIMDGTAMHRGATAKRPAQQPSPRGQLLCRAVRPAHRAPGCAAPHSRHPTCPTLAACLRCWSASSLWAMCLALRSFCRAGEGCFPWRRLLCSTALQSHLWHRRQRCGKTSDFLLAAGSWAPLPGPYFAAMCESSSYMDSMQGQRRS